MHSGSKAALLAAGSAVLALLALWFWLQGNPATPVDNEVAGQAEVATGLTALDKAAQPESSNAELETEAVASYAANSSATRPAVDGNAADDMESAAEPLTIEQEVVQREVESSIAAALAGDQNEALELGSFLNECRLTFRDRRNVEQSIERAQRSFSQGKPLTQFRPIGPARQFESLEGFESSQWDTFFRCEAARRLVNDDFWSNLEAQAEAGNPVARYLFATLMRDSPSGVMAFENWDEELELREQSRDYTWRNLEEREPLGLLALVQLEGFGMSMRGNSISNSSVMILAAVKCGLNTPDLLQAVDQILQMAERLETAQPGALERLNNASDEARRMFCK